MKTRNLLLELIDEILIHEGGNITVKFKFDDAYKDALEYIEIIFPLTKKRLKPVCSSLFLPCII